MENKFRSEKLPSTPIETDAKLGQEIPLADIIAALSKATEGRLSPQEIETMFTTGKPIVKDDGAE
jgi:hypothetical protein